MVREAIKNPPVTRRDTDQNEIDHESPPTPIDRGGRDGAILGSAAADPMVPVLSRSPPPQAISTLIGGSTLRTAANPVSLHNMGQGHQIMGADVVDETAGAGGENGQQQYSNEVGSAEPSGTSTPTTIDEGLAHIGSIGHGSRDARAVPSSKDLPWDEELGRARGGGEGEMKRENEAEASPGRLRSTLGASGGQRVTEGGESPGVSSRYPPTPLSAPLAKKGTGGKIYAATTSSLPTNAVSARTTSIFGGDVSLKGTGQNGATLAGTLLAYMSGPDGKFDIFRAARDGQVMDLRNQRVRSIVTFLCVTPSLGSSE